MENQVEKFANAVAAIKEGEFVTVIKSGDFGFVNVFQAKVVSAEHTKYAQYQNSIKLVFRQPRQKKNRCVHLHEGTKFLILQGKHDIKNDIFGTPEDRGNGVTISRGLYSACDDRWFTDAVARAEGIERIIYNDKGY